MRDTNGYFPRWRLKTEGRILPDERLPTGQTMVLGLQHGWRSVASSPRGRFMR